MGTNLHQLLRSFCFGTHWKYAIFWKLKHRARIILTWEDAYYEGPGCYEDSSENKCCQKTLEKIGSGSFLHDPLGLAVAKVSYHVYLLREGIVGQVAVTGKHRWICVDNEVIGSGPFFEFADGWQSQFSAGIRTIVVVAIVPLGVVQLGSLNKLHDMEKDVHESSSHQQGSSWAMEMLCEECSHFLEIAEAIRSLSLTILNGATQAHGEKTCICFVVEAGSEGQSNRNLHRLDILWPLVQLLQSKSTMPS